MSTMCFDVRRIDDDYVCIYRAEHNHFGFSCHVAESSYCELEDEDKAEDFIYHYIIVAKDKNYEGIERILYSCANKAHSYAILEGCKDKTGIYYHDKCYGYRIIRFPIYKKKFAKYCNLGDVKVPVYVSIPNKLNDTVKIHCPKKLNQKYKIYGTFLSKRKVRGGACWRGPKLLRRKNG